MLALTKEERKAISAAATFDGQIALTEYEYNMAVSHLLRTCEVASKHKNKALLKELSGISKAWIKYFRAIKSYLKSAPKSTKTSHAEGVLCFVDDQIKFFSTLSHEIDAGIKSIN